MEGCFCFFSNFWSLTLKDLVFIGNEVELHHFLDYFLLYGITHLVRKIFRKTDIYYPLIYFAYVLNE